MARHAQRCQNLFCLFFPCHVTHLHSLTLSRRIIPNSLRIGAGSAWERVELLRDRFRLNPCLLTAHLRMTMRTLHGPTEKQLPIPPSRAIKTYAVRNPIPFLDALSAIRAFRLVVRTPEERHSHRQRKNHPENTYRQRDWNGQVFRLDHHRCCRHTNEDKHQQDIANDGQDSKLTQLPAKQVFTILHIEPSHFPDCGSRTSRRSPPWRRCT